MSKPQQYPDSSELPCSLSLILSPPNSSLFLMNLRLLFQGGVRLCVCVCGGVILFIKPSSLLFLLPLISQKEKGENSVYHIQSSEQVNVHIKLNFRALTEDRWLGGDGSKTQVNHKGCPPPPSRSLAFVNTDLKRDGLVVAWGDNSQSAPSLTVYSSLNTALHNSTHRDTINTISPATSWTQPPSRCLINEWVW